MKKIVILGVLVLFLFGCKSNKDDGKTTTKLTTTTTVAQNVANKIDPAFAKEIAPFVEYLNMMQGGYPNKFVNMVDAEFTTVSGKSAKLSDYKGKVIFLNLWATWCPPCKAKMPSMEKLYQKYKNKDFVMLGIDQGEDAATVNPFLKKHNYSFPVFLDPSRQIGSTYGTGSIPTTWIINKKGYLIAQFVGGREWDSQQSFDLFDALLK